MKAIRADLPENLDVAELHVLSDWHIGDKHSDADAINKKITHIKDTPGAYAIVAGDVMDTATTSSIGDTYEANLTPMQQIEHAVKLLTPIKDKIIAIIPGNHEARVERSDGIETLRIVASQLGLVEKYSNTTALCFVRVGKRNHGRKSRVCYVVYVTHGSGGGRKSGGKVNRLIDYCQIVDADIYVAGHVHEPAVLRKSFFRPDSQHSTVSITDKLFVSMAATLDYGGYADRQGYTPASKVSPVIYLDGREKRAWAEI